MKSRVIVISALLIVAICFGFLVENVKVNVNYILERSELIPGFFEQSPELRQQMMDSKRINAPFDYYHNHRSIDYLYEFSKSGLIRLKWINSLVFTVIFMMINAYLMKLTTGKSSFFKWTVWLYLFFFGLSFAIYLFGKFTGTLEHAYGVSRKIAGALQSLVPLMLLLPASWLINFPLMTERNEKN